MITRRTSSAPQSPNPGASRAAGGSPPPAAEGAHADSYERMWGIVLALAAGAAIGGILLLVAWRPFVDLMVMVLTS